MENTKENTNLSYQISKSLKFKKTLICKRRHLFCFLVQFYQNVKECILVSLPITDDCIWTHHSVLYTVMVRHSFHLRSKSAIITHLWRLFIFLEFVLSSIAQIKLVTCLPCLFFSNAPTVKFYKSSFLKYHRLSNVSKNLFVD